MKKINRIHILIVALISGLFGAYVVLNSFAATDPTSSDNSSGQDITVNNESSECTKVLNAGGNLQNFINSLNAGDTGCLRAGVHGSRGSSTYFSRNGTVDNPIVLKSYPGDSKPTILGHFAITGGNLTISGFVFDGPTGPSSPSTPENVLVAIYDKSNVIFSDNEVKNGQWHAGIYIWEATNVKILRNYIHDNGQFNNPAMANLDHGIYWDKGSGIIANNVIEHNYSYGIQLYTAPNNVKVLNNTITGHTGRGGIIIAEEATNSVIANNIISNNKYGINVYALTGLNNIVDTNIFWNNTGGNILGSGLSVSNSILSNPLFAGAKDYNLTSGSPAIDTANSNHVVSPDYRSVARPQNSGGDIGAYEFQSSAPAPNPTPAPTPTPDTSKPTVNITSPANNASVSGIITINATATDNAGVTKVEFLVDESLKLTDNSSPYSYSLDTKALENGSRTVAAKAYDAAGNNATTTITININNADITAPNAPSGLSATAISSSTVNLSWGAATDTGANQTGLSKYNVLRKGPNESNYSVIAQINAPTTTYSNTGLVASSQYSYRVQAVDGAGNTSGNSNTTTVTTPTAPDTSKPSTPGNLKANAINPNQVNLTWNSSTDSGGSGLAGYNVYRDGVKINGALITTTSYGDSTVDPNKTYSYQLEAVDGAGNKSGKTSNVDAVTPGISVKRGDVTGPSGQPDGQIDLRDISYAIRKLNTSDTSADVTGPSGVPDGIVDLRDISYLIRNYGK